MSTKSIHHDESRAKTGRRSSVTVSKKTHHRKTTEEQHAEMMALFAEAKVLPSHRHAHLEIVDSSPSCPFLSELATITSSG